MAEPLWFIFGVVVGAVSLYALAQSSRLWRARSADTPVLRDDYFKGINFLLNEQPDQAIEVFIRLLEVDDETVETHVALGNLYRRRGEVDRAIRIHQNLVARTNLTDLQRLEAVVELAQDYQGAGLLDRAEALYQELCDAESYQVQALRQLIDIYEQEKDWENAIRCARRFEQATGNQLGPIVAHYLCEQAEALRSSDPGAALKLLGHALDTHRGCVRASLLESDIWFDSQDYERAVRALRRIEEQDPGFLPETYARAAKCFRALGQPEGLLEYFSAAMHRYGDVGAAIEVAKITQSASGTECARDGLVSHLGEHRSIRGIDQLLRYELEVAAEHSQPYLQVLKRFTSDLLRDHPVYKCRHCGFPAKAIHWQCPSCKHWNTVEPLRSIHDR